MNYLILNIIIVAVLILIYMIASKDNSSGFFDMLTLFALQVYMLVICPIVISLVNIIASLANREYVFALISLTPLMVPLIAVFLEKIKEFKYLKLYNKYNSLVCGYVENFLVLKGMESKDIQLKTSYDKRLFSKQSDGKIQCYTHVKLYNQDIEAYTLKKEIENYLKTMLPQLQSMVRLEFATR